MLRAAVIVLLIALLPTHARAEAKIALLIGNQAYDPSVGVLKNPHNDIAVVGQALGRQGFEVLPVIKDARRSTILGGVRELVRRLNGAGAGAIGFIYYSGHGAAEKDTNINYLIPVDAKEPGTSAFWDDSVKLDDVLRPLDGARSAAKFIVFDACRSELQLPTKDTTKGLVPVVEQQGMFIAYASAPGHTASDRGVGSGPYAAALATELGRAGLDHLNLFQNVKEAVLAATGGAQQPWESNGLGQRVFLTGQANPAAVGSSIPTREATEAWDRTKDTTSIALLETYVARYGDTYYAELARARVNDLKKQQVAIATPPPPPPAQPVARCDGVETQVGSERQCLRPKDTFRDCPTCPDMVVAPAGTFTMGSPANEPQRGRTDLVIEGHNEAQVRVTIFAPFAVGKYAVTFDDWDTCVAEGGCNGYMPADQGWGRGKQPVINVNLDDVRAYAAWLSRKAGKTYRLLSEAEREYVTRAGTTTPFWWGSSITPQQANYDGSGAPYKGGGSKGENRQRTVPVDSFEPNPWGFHNVHGNVWEWTEDCWNGSNTDNPGDGRTRMTGDCNRRVARGGSWYDYPQFLRSACRFGPFAIARTNVLGFRVARTFNP
jgi:formylglycine-generating enzyme required for sulfatase activity